MVQCHWLHSWLKMLPLFRFAFYISSISIVYSDILFEELKAPIMHPRTFYLSPSQEFQVINQVLCEDIPCPEFHVMQDHPYFIQQRSYRAARFLKLTSARRCSFKTALDDGRLRLDKYTKGSNNREERYRKTLPLLIEIHQVTSKSKNPWCHMNFSANFYIPHFWGTIATPTEINLDLLNIDEDMQVYVQTFDGDIEKVLFKEIELFRRNLDTLGFCYKKLTFYVAIYDVPHSPHDSRLELWFLKCNSRLGK